MQPVPAPHRGSLEARAPSAWRSAAAGDGAKNLAIEATGLWKLKIGFRAASANEARAAVQRVSSLLELTRYEIDFAVSVGK